MRTQKFLQKICFLFVILVGLSSGTVLAQTNTIRFDFVGYTFDNDTTYIIDDFDEVNIVHITSGTLTIPAGTTIKFAEDNSLIIDAGAIISATGNSANKVTFTGTVQTPAGYWHSIKFDGDDDENVAEGYFEHCVFKYGGVTEVGINDASGPIVVSSWSYVTVENSEFHDN